MIEALVELYAQRGPLLATVGIALGLAVGIFIAAIALIVTRNL